MGHRLALLVFTDLVVEPVYCFYSVVSPLDETDQSNQHRNYKQRYHPIHNNLLSFMFFRDVNIDIKCFVKFTVVVIPSLFSNPLKKCLTHPTRTNLTFRFNRNFTMLFIEIALNLWWFNNDPTQLQSLPIRKQV